ncbi:MAG TPA: lytic murein transglycosylase B [Burkholderiaceae bacterium]|nr:lytic murein transglycosylase B [Burkholderiaceae bacterium]
MKQSRRKVLAALALIPLVSNAIANTRTPYLQRAEVQQFIDELIAQHGFDRQRIERWFSQARYSASVERYMQPPVSFAQRNWIDYRARYLDEPRVLSGAAFVRNNQAAMERAQREFGVPPEIIAAIIGVETNYGRITGNFRTLDALVTLSFDYLRRAEYFRRELIEFFLLTREQNADPLQIKGSFAGALGLPQFMPGSIRRHAVDFDGDGRVDLTSSAADAIGSVASFLAAHGWERDAPIVFDAIADEAIVDALGRGIKATVTWSDALGAGVEGDVPLPLDARVLVIDLPIADGGEVERLYRVGTVNFSALLHYNRSYFYASAVVDLSRAILQAANR